MNPISAFLLGIVFLIAVGPSGCAGYEWGKSHAESSFRRSAEWVDNEAKKASLEMELADLRQEGERQLQARRSALSAQFQTWETNERNAHSARRKSADVKIAALRKQLESLPVPNAKQETRPFATSLSEREFRRKLERWARKERKNEWKRFVETEDSAKKFRESLADSAKKAARTGRKAEEMPGWRTTSNLCAEAETECAKVKAALVSAFLESTQKAVVAQVRGILDASGPSSKSLESRIAALDAKIDETMQDTKDHLRL